MEDAIAAVKNGQMKVIRAAKVYSVPQSTLHDLVSGKVKHGDKPGPKPYLSSTEEKELADFLVRRYYQSGIRQNKEASTYHHKIMCT